MCPSLTLKTLFSLLEIQGDSLVTTSFQPGLRYPSLIPGLTRTTPVTVTPKVAGSGARIRTWEMAVPKTAALPLGYARSLSAYSIVSMLRLYHAARVLTRCQYTA